MHSTCNVLIISRPFEDVRSMRTAYPAQECNKTMFELNL
jgi:hypothetical protein